MISKRTKALLNIGMITVIAFFAFSLFKNIAHPLLWNDEASTAMFGRRVLEYGYPKVHDEKNSLYLWSDANFNVGIRSQGDVYVAEGWAQYYLAALGDYLANQTNDIYAKTAMMRIPFALAGFLAIILFGLTVSLFFGNHKKKAFLAFFIFELFSVSLILHLREARYYSLILLFSTILINIYLRYAILKTLPYKYYIWTVPLFITLLFHTHYPIAVIFILTLGTHSLILSFFICQDKFNILIREFFRSTLPLWLSLIFIIPSLIYFKTFAMAKAMALQYALSSKIYIHNISLAFSFFAKFEFLYLAILLKILLIALLCGKNYIADDKNKILLKTSNFLTLFFCIYIFIIARTLLLFERYIIVLQPVLVFMILLDITLCWRIFNKPVKLTATHKKNAPRILAVMIVLVFSLNFIPHLQQMKGHWYELTHKYMGPLDFAIPYIQEKFNDPSKIIIATNYEENSYMYYLNSKTIVGYVGNNLTEDRKLQPDIVIYRKYFNFDPAYVDVFNTFLRNQKYQKISFPVFDYPFNNIPELNYTVNHLYKTKFAENDNEKLDLYLKQ